MKTHGKIFVITEGGIVQDVLTTIQADMKLIVIDHDTEGMDDEEYREYEKSMTELDNTREVKSLMY